MRLLLTKLPNHLLLSLLLVGVLTTNSCQHKSEEAVAPNPEEPVLSEANLRRSSGTLEEQLGNDIVFKIYLMIGAELYQTHLNAIQANPENAEKHLAELNGLVKAATPDEGAVIAKLGFKSNDDFKRLTRRFDIFTQYLNRKYPELKAMLDADKKLLYDKVISKREIGDLVVATFRKTYYQHAYGNSFNPNSGRTMRDPCWVCNLSYWGCSAAATGGYVVAAAGCTALSGGTLVAICTGGAFIGASGGIAVCAAQLASCRSDCY